MNESLKRESSTLSESERTRVCVQVSSESGRQRDFVLSLWPVGFTLRLVARCRAVIESTELATPSHQYLTELPVRGA